MFWIAPDSRDDNKHNWEAKRSVDVRCPGVSSRRFWMLAMGRDSNYGWKPGNVNIPEQQRDGLSFNASLSACTTLPCKRMQVMLRLEKKKRKNWEAFLIIWAHAWKKTMFYSSVCKKYTHTSLGTASAQCCGCFFLFLEQFGIVSRLLQTLIVTMLCKQKVL